MKTHNTIEREINQIRLKIYEQTKDMTPSQITEYYKKSGEASAKKYGFTIVASAKEKIERGNFPRRETKLQEGE